MKPVWHATSAEDAEAHLATHRQHGLSAEEVARRLAEHGPNQLAAAPGRPAWRRFLDQLTA
ncbi:MAG TPA: cation-transporting P-type ATPase, partial [Rhodocyclaceae bacterium]|nr:cation-transporting P-type ATPase [Rhodocyclaceae bacterium]